MSRVQRRFFEYECRIVEFSIIDTSVAEPHYLDTAPAQGMPTPFHMPTYILGCKIFFKKYAF
jgi:hypothetical protein